MYLWKYLTCRTCLSAVDDSDNKFSKWNEFPLLPLRTFFLGIYHSAYFLTYPVPSISHFNELFLLVSMLDFVPLSSSIDILSKVDFLFLYVLTSLDLRSSNFDIVTTVKISSPVSTSVALSATLNALSLMFPNERRIVRGSSSNHLLRHRNASAKHFRQGRSVISGDANDEVAQNSSTLSFLRLPPLREYHFAPITMCEYINKFRLYLDARRLTAMHEHGNKLDFVDACLGTRRDITLEARKERWILFGCTAET